MCGIVGVLGCGALEIEQEKVRQEIMMFLTTELMNLTESRGKDASGVAAMFENGEYIVIKSGMPAPTFISMFEEKDGKTYKKFLNICRNSGSSVKSLIGHCRKASVGNSWDNKNNHPIRVGDIVGVHNGTLKNHDRIFELLGTKRDGVVDSESIFSLFDHFTNSGKEPFTADLVKDIAKKLDGTYAVIAANGNNPYQIAVMRDARPMDVAILKDYGIVLISSEKKFLQNALFSMNLYSNLHGMGVATNFFKGSVEFGEIKNFHAAVIDLTATIDKDTVLADIITEERIGVVDADWREETTTIYNVYGGHYGSRGASAKTDTKLANKSADGVDKKNTPDTALKSTISMGVTVSKSKTTEDPKKDNKPSGMIWDKNGKRFKDIARTGGDKSLLDSTIDDLNAVEVMPINNSIKEITADGDGGTTIIIKDAEPDGNNNKTMRELEPDNSKFEKPHSTGAEIESYHMGAASRAGSGNNTTDNEDLETAEVENVEKVNKEALEKAYKYKRDLALYESDDDLAQSLEVTPASVRSFPAYALANRINRYMTTGTYYDGYMEASNEGIKNSNSVSDGMSKTTAETHIRVLKVVLNMVLSLVSGTRIADVSRAIVKSMNGGSEITSEKFRKVVSEGDVKRHRVLRWMGSILRDKESR